MVDECKPLKPLSPPSLVVDDDDVDDVAAMSCRRPAARGLHSSTFRLNISTF
jgi:hypothetical protein